MISKSSTEDETTQFLAKQEIVWKGFLNMLTVAKFVTKGYLVSGSAENLKTVKCTVAFLDLVFLIKTNNIVMLCYAMFD